MTCQTSIALEGIISREYLVTSHAEPTIMFYLHVGKTQEDQLNVPIMVSGLRAQHLIDSGRIRQGNRCLVFGVLQDDGTEDNSYVTASLVGFDDFDLWKELTQR
ncbi:hypothetical protein [Trueperella sp. LYQ143]|uniref:hypothetical protein n=1 Tax=Trueperella sp. LYQ143 TaxID=3391059 RepID=UPI00398385FC